MISISNRKSCAFFLIVRLLLWPVAVVVGFHIIATTVTTTTTTANTRRSGNRHLYAFKGQGNDDFFEKDDALLNNTNGAVGFFDPLGNYPLTNNNKNKPNKLDLYSVDELWDVLNIHNQLTQDGNEIIDVDDKVINDENNSKKKNGNDLSMGISPGLHEMVLEALQQMEATDATAAAAAAAVSPNTVILNDKLRSKLRKIRAIASDVDGTLVAAKYNVHPTTQAAVIEAVQAAYGDDTSSSTSSSTSKMNDLQLFFLATGKSRAGAMESLGSVINRVMNQYSVPGVFIQGLYCVDETGRVIFEKRLTTKAVLAATQFALDYNNNNCNLSMFGYNGDIILTTKQADPQHVQDYHDVYGEPRPIIIDSFIDYQPGFHKILFLSNNHERLKHQLRPKLDTLAVENNCATTQAVPNMIELLPAGCSKALGVAKLCQHYGIDPSTQLLAIGDAENDIGMLEMASVGVAVGNASPLVKDVADIVMNESNIQGGAGIAITQYGLGKALYQ